MDDFTFRGLTRQVQPSPMSCAQTCIAMAMDVPVADVIKLLGDKGMTQRQLLSALDRFGLVWNRLVFDTIVHTGWYFASVPSLNVKGGMHQVLVHFDYERGCSGITVMDPSARIAYDQRGADLYCYRELVIFRPGGRLK